MRRNIISDTSCIILFDKIGELEILRKLFGTIITTTLIAKEFGSPLAPWFEIKDPNDKNYQSLIETFLDKVEASAIALAIELENCLLIIDDRKGRRFAEKIGLTITGSAGIIVDAKLKGIISSVGPILLKIRETNFRITDTLEQLILKKAGE